eukprot:COSAG02_NODE_3604_length_6492_cov_3.323166_4_plen_50_part_00
MLLLLLYLLAVFALLLNDSVVYRTDTHVCMRSCDSAITTQKWHEQGRVP